MERQRARCRACRAACAARDRAGQLRCASVQRRTRHDARTCAAPVDLSPALAGRRNGGISGAGGGCGRTRLARRAAEGGLMAAPAPQVALRHIFERDGDLYAPTALATGPWDPRLQRGVVLNALRSERRRGGEEGVGWCSTWY